MYIGYIQQALHEYSDLRREDRLGQPRIRIDAGIAQPRQWQVQPPGAGILADAGVKAVVTSTDLAEGRIEFYWGAFAIVRPQVQAGKARLIAFSNTARFAEEPKVPTVAEAGFPELNYDGLVGLFAPRELAPDVRERIGADVMAAAADPAVSARLLTTGQVVSPGNAADFAAEIDKQRAIAAAIAKELGIKPAMKSQ